MLDPLEQRLAAISADDVAEQLPEIAYVGILADGDGVAESGGPLGRHTLRRAGSSSSEISRMLASDVDSGMPTQCMRSTMWLTPNSSQ